MPVARILIFSPGGDAAKGGMGRLVQTLARSSKSSILTGPA
jgi:hypothetical protein